jgi:hypothetical protein
LTGAFNPKIPGRFTELHSLTHHRGRKCPDHWQPGTGKATYKARLTRATPQGYSVKYVEADSDFVKFGLATQAEQAVSPTDPDLLVSTISSTRRIAEAQKAACR